MNNLVREGFGLDSLSDISKLEMIEFKDCRTRSASVGAWKTIHTVLEELGIMNVAPDHQVTQTREPGNGPNTGVIV